MALWLPSEAGGGTSILSPSLSAARDLFNAAFVSCWSGLNEDQLGLRTHQTSSWPLLPGHEVTQTLLNCIEFRHSDSADLVGASWWEEGLHLQPTLACALCICFLYCGVLLSSRALLRDVTALSCWARGLPGCRAATLGCTTRTGVQKGPTPAILESLIR